MLIRTAVSALSCLQLSGCLESDVLIPFITTNVALHSSDYRQIDQTLLSCTPGPPTTFQSRLYNVKNRTIYSFSVRDPQYVISGQNSVQQSRLTVSLYLETDDEKDSGTQTMSRIIDCLRRHGE